jgi:hypothetical protein
MAGGDSLVASRGVVGLGAEDVAGNQAGVTALYVAGGDSAWSTISWSSSSQPQAFNNLSSVSARGIWRPDSILAIVG